MSGLALMAPNSKHIHFIGICGTAMGSTAVALRAWDTHDQRLG
jgi:UDP-N-acetylmuramate-alanine ligase